jgi:hypothetical protein
MKLLSKFAFLTMLLFGANVYAQEDCDDGIDNDGDALVDLNDPDCDCAGLGGGGTTIDGLIPNPSFEDKSCCPTTFGMLTCADDWIQASTATSDYWNTCASFTWTSFVDAALPLPGDPGGEGYGGFISQTGYSEFIGACLTSPMLAGVPYVLNMWVAQADGNPDLTITIYGTDDCVDLPWTGSACPIGVGGWVVLDAVDFTFPTESDWYEVTLSFTPTVDIAAVAIGGACSENPVPGSGASYNYYYL